MADRGQPASKLPTAYKPVKAAMPTPQQPAPQVQQGQEATQHAQQVPVQHPPNEGKEIHKDRSTICR